MSMARRRAVVINHAPGLSGIPCSGHFSSAATRLSWTTSSARAKSPKTRISAVVSRPASSLKTAAKSPMNSGEFMGTPYEAAWVVACVSSAFRVVDQGPDLDDAAAGPCLGHAERFIEILHFDDREAADDLLRLDERAVCDCGLAVLDTDGGCGGRTLELSAPGDPARLAVLLEPLVYAPVGSDSCGLRHLFPGILLVDAPSKHQHVLHSTLQNQAVSIAASFIRRSGGARNRHGHDPVNSGSCFERKLMMPIAASVLIVARAKLAASTSSASSSGRS